MKTLLGLFLLILAGAPLLAADKQTARPIVTSDGQGSARVFWGASPDLADLRLETEDGRVLLDKITPYAGKATDKTGRALAILTAMGDWRQAQALGLGAEIHGLPARPTVFVVRRLDNGKAIRSEPIDLAQATPAAPAPLGLRAEAGDDDVKLYWQPATSPIPVLTYRIERDDGRRRVSPLDQPLLTGSRWPADKPAYQDRPEVGETEVVYRVQGIDLLGRESEAATVRVFVPDFTALYPPRGLTALAQKTPVQLQWRANASANTRAYLVERAFQTGGPWEVLTPTGVASTGYADPEAKPGSTLFYRLRAIGPRGDVGEPGLPLPVNVRGEPPAAPAGLAAEVGYSRVRLSWRPVSGAAAYHVERRAGEARDWSRLTTRPTPEARYDDVYGGSPGGRFEYRIYAIAPDEQAGEPGRPLVVALPDTVPPSPPQVIATSGENGRVRLAFRAALPAADTVSVLVLRGAGAEEPGLVIGDPVSAGKGEFIDTWVDAGKTYVYRLVAVDAVGNRGDPGTAVKVRVGTPSLGVPGKFEARYLAEPFPHVKLNFAVPPRGLSVLVEAGEGGNVGLPGVSPTYRAAAGPVAGGEAIDLAPRRETPRYRLRYRSANGAVGEASAEVVVNIP